MQRHPAKQAARTTAPRAAPPRIARLFALALLASGGCSNARDASSADSSRLHAAVTDSLVGPGAREGAWADADETSTWRAVLDGPHVLRIDEVSTFTDSARSMREFHFDTAGALVAFHEARRQLLYGQHATPDTVRTVIDLEWEHDSLVRSAKRVDDADRLLQPFEVDNFRAHAAELLRLVRSGAAPRPSGTQP